MAETQQQSTEFEPEPIESTSTEIVKIMQEGDPDTMLAIMEKKAALAGRMTKALNTLLVNCTYPEDWINHGDTMCLKSAAAERVSRHFDIRFVNVKHQKEEFTDGSGKAYRYIYEGEASMGNRVIFAQGVYGTRDKFLGFKNQEWRPLEDINENNIRNAAYHIVLGNGVKALLGLRGIPVARFNEIMKGSGESPQKASNVSYSQGTQGGTNQDDSVLRKQFGELLIEIANACYGVAVDDKGKHSIEQMSEASDPMEVAKASCQAITSFYSKKDSKVVNGLDSAKAVKGQRLEIAVRNLNKLWGDFDKGGQQ